MRDGHDEGEAEAERLRAEIGRLRTALRVNILRLAPDTGHSEIDALVERIRSGESA
jgi:hypothetical protein